MDREWLRQLAQARTEQGRLVPNDPEGLKRDAMRHLMSAAAILQQEAEDWCAIFNMYAPKEQLRILPLAATTPGRVLPQGFMMLLGGQQVRIEQHQYTLKASLIYIEAFQQREKPLHVFEAKVDMFGGIHWIMDQKTTVTNEMILKTLLRILREAGESRKV